MGQEEHWTVQNGHELDGSGFVGFWVSGPVRGSRSEAEADIPRPNLAARSESERLGTILLGLENKERPPLTHVAIRVDGVVWSLPKPHRHHHVLRLISEMSETKYNDADEKDQGFLDSNGRYLTRPQAFVNADLNGQIKNGKIIGGVLTSEDLW